MTAHDPQHEALLQDVLVGDLADDAPEVAALLDSCPECRTRLEELRSLAGSLDAAAAEQRAVVADAATADDAPGLGDVDRILRERATAPPPPISLASKRRRLARPFAAAILVLFFAAVVVIVDRMGGEPKNGDQILNSDGLTATVPVGSVTEITEFRWEGALPAGETFTLQFFALDSDPGVPPIKVVEWIRGSSWTPETGEIPWREFEWNVVTTSETGAPRLRSERTSVEVLP